MKILMAFLVLSAFIISGVSYAVEKEGVKAKMAAKLCSNSNASWVKPEGELTTRRCK